MHAEQAQQNFISRFRRNELPEDMPEIELEAQEAGLAIGYVLKGAGLVASTSEALRMIKQGAVKLDAERVSDGKLMLPIGAVSVVQVGKRKVARVTLVHAKT